MSWIHLSWTNLTQQNKNFVAFVVHLCYNNYSKQSGGIQNEKIQRLPADFARFPYLS